MKPFQPRPILLYILLSFGLAWLVALPCWLHLVAVPYLLQGEPNTLLFAVIGAITMGTPTLAAIIVSRATEPEVKLADSLGLRPWKPLGRTLLFCGFALLASATMHAVALAIGSALGFYRFDFLHYSGLAELLKTAIGNTDVLAKLPPLKVLVFIQTLSLVLASLINAVFALGEEIGWRGWLLPRLLPLGTFPALVASGVIWGLWHAPLLLLGCNYGSIPGWLSLSCMTAMCISLGSVLAWIRLRSRSVWPCAIGHGAFNAYLALVFIFGAAGQKIDPTQATVLGWSGWIFPILLAVVLFCFFPIKNGSTEKL